METATKKQKDWQKLVLEYKTLTGVSQREFCKGKNVSKSRFNYYFHKYVNKPKIESNFTDLTSISKRKKSYRIKILGFYIAELEVLNV